VVIPGGAVGVIDGPIPPGIDVMPGGGGGGVGTPEPIPGTGSIPGGNRMGGGGGRGGCCCCPSLG